MRKVIVKSDTSWTRFIDVDSGECIAKFGDTPVGSKLVDLNIGVLVAQEIKVVFE